MNEVLQRIEALRKHKKITVYKLVKALNMSQSTYTTWISNDRVPKPDKLQQIAEYFNVSVDYLLTGDEQEANDSDFINAGDVLQSLWQSVDDGKMLLPSGKICADERSQKTLKDSIQLLMNVVDNVDK